MIRKLNVKQPEPERYFKSDFLERFTFFKLSTVWLIWCPIVFLSLFGSFYTSGKNNVSDHFSLIAVATLLLVLVGAVRWTLLEYFLHRFLFHYEGQNETRQKISWYVHGIHHKQAMLSNRLVAPPLFSLTLGAVIGLFDWLIMGLLFKAGWVGLALYSGTAMGYLIYDTFHWCFHFIDADWAWYRKLRKHHMHHHTYPDNRFGVSNTLWDHLFHTYPPKQFSKSFKSQKAEKKANEAKAEDGQAENLTESQVAEQKLADGEVLQNNQAPEKPD